MWDHLYDSHRDGSSLNRYLDNLQLFIYCCSSLDFNIIFLGIQHQLLFYSNYQMDIYFVYVAMKNLGRTLTKKFFE
jgi:hypothetical protein